MNNKILFLDLDGVLADFEGHILELGYDETTFTVEEEFQKNIVNKEYDQGFFRNLKPLPTLFYLKEYLQEMPNPDFEIKFLSYVGAHSRIRMVIDDKSQWLEKHSLGEFEFVPVVEDSKYKRLYSRKGTKLLDDNLDLVVSFMDSGEGRGYHIDKTIKDVSAQGYQNFKTIITDW